MELEKTILVELPMATYLKYFGKERIEKVEFLPLIEDKKSCINKYDVDWRKFKWEDRIDLLFKFFSFNIGEKVEIGVIYGSANCILAKSTFIVGGRLENEWIKPIEILENGYCHNYFDFRKIYYAKCVGS